MGFWAFLVLLLSGVFCSEFCQQEKEEALLVQSNDLARWEALAKCAIDHEEHETTIIAFLQMLDLLKEMARKRPEVLENIHSLFFNIGYTYEQMGNFQKALDTYSKVLDLSPQFVPAYLRIGYLQNQMGNLKEAASALEKARKLPGGNEAETLLYLSRTLLNLRDYKAAADALQEANEMDPQNPEILSDLGDALVAIHKYTAAISYFQDALDILPTFGPALSGMLRAKLSACEWHELDKLAAKAVLVCLSSLDVSRECSISPFDALFLDLNSETRRRIAVEKNKELIESVRSFFMVNSDIALYRAISVGEEKRSCPNHTICEPSIYSPANTSQIRLGYISRRFGDYMGTQMMKQMFKLHDRSKFMVFAYAANPSDGSEARKVVENESDMFLDISEMSTMDAAVHIAMDEIDVLVSCDGAHSSNTLDILALRPAPVQISFLGFPGTTGAIDELGRRVIDFIVVDPVLVPFEDATLRSEFTERLLYMPGSYQPQDDTHDPLKLSPRPKRGEYRLPEEPDANGVEFVILGSFNDGL